jgi:hypothetical protein
VGLVGEEGETLKFKGVLGGDDVDVDGLAVDAQKGQVEIHLGIAPPEN